MPRATVNLTSTTRHDLKTCPGGYVELRPLTYGQMLERRAMSARMRMEIGKKQDLAGTMDLMQKVVTVFEFTHCIVEHNLEHEDGRPLNLRQQADIDQLDPRVGTEIDSYINKLNQGMEEEDPSSQAGSGLP